MESRIVQIFAINLEKRRDRRAHIIRQFSNREEFKVNIVMAKEHKSGSFGLWQTIKHIIQNLAPTNEDYIVICEDDHEFTDSYNRASFFQAIDEAKEKNADVLMGGVSWYKNALQISESLFWVDKFSGLQFTVIFRKFFESILQTDFKINEAADYKISAISQDKLFLYPFISIQKEFGYSDVTTQNNTHGYVTTIFSDASEKLGYLIDVAMFYKS